MQNQKQKIWKRLWITFILYILLCLLIWGFLIVDTRSHNRLFREQVSVANLKICEDNSAALSLATQTIYFSPPSLEEKWTFMFCTLPCFSGNAVVIFSQVLFQFDIS